MLSVLLDWLIIAITSYTVGYGFLRLMSICIGREVSAGKNANVLRLLTGFMLTNVYAEIWSIFSPVNMWAVYILVFITLVIAYMCKQDMAEKVNISKAPKPAVIASVAVILLMAYGSSRGYMHYDTTLYHASAIRWIEEYGVVPGLANLQSRYGYNSAEFAHNALYSFKWYTGRSLHCTTGFLAMVSAHLLYDKELFTGKRTIQSVDFVRIGLLYYLGVLFARMVSPASDYVANLLIFDILILMLGRVNDRTLPADHYVLISLLAIYGITVKVSLAPMVLICLIPFVYYIIKKEVRSILFCIVSGLVIAMPYFIRGYILSGWILYPSTLIKLGNPDWQVPIGEAQYDAKEISMWGRGITDATKWSEVTLTNWIPSWFAALDTVEKVLITAVITSTVVLVAIEIRLGLSKNRGGLQRNNILLELPIAWIMLLGVLTWFFGAPLVRYGLGFVLSFPLLVVGILYELEFKEVRIAGINKDRTGSDRSSPGERKEIVGRALFLIIACVMVLMKVKGLVVDIAGSLDRDCLIWQQDYEDPEAFTYEVNGVTIYVAKNGGGMGYNKFPSSIEVKDNIELRGSELKDGFRVK
ncbi:MAG: hypothetical protein KBG05_07300 [Lachnospiraceae bacterium]|nr:hypothetical protein [Lachnospiraceae bacterium]